MIVDLPEPESREMAENLIPLINIVFLLLIFFMVAGAIEAIDAFEVEPPESESETQPAQDGWTLLVGADGRLAIGDAIFPIEELQSRVEAGLSGSDGGEGAADSSGPAAGGPIRVKMARTAESDLLLDVLEALRRAGVARIVLVTERE